MAGKRILILTTFVLAVFLLAPPLALADTVTLSLSNPVQSAAPGSTITFDATVFASSTNTAPIFLNSDSFTIDSPLMLEDSDFFGFPVSLNPGDSYTGSLFTVNLPANLASQNYTGFFEILGGADGSTFTSLASAGFQVAPTPEPSTMLLSVTGFGLLAFMICREKACLSERHRVSLLIGSAYTVRVSVIE